MREALQQVGVCGVRECSESWRSRSRHWHGWMEKKITAKDLEWRQRRARYQPLYRQKILNRRLVW